MGRDWAWTRYRAGARSQVRSRRFQSPCREWRLDPLSRIKVQPTLLRPVFSPYSGAKLAIRAAGTGVGPETTARLSAPHFPSDPSDSPDPSPQEIISGRWNLGAAAWVRPPLPPPPPPPAASFLSQHCLLPLPSTAVPLHLPSGTSPLSPPSRTVGADRQAAPKTVRTTPPRRKPLFSSLPPVPRRVSHTVRPRPSPGP